MSYWLFKSEPETYSIDDLKKAGFSSWEGVRNYQARNYLRDEVKYGDLVLFYHSNASPPGVAGICRVCREPFPDHTAQDAHSKYYDPRATAKKPIWYMVEVEFVEKFPTYVSRTMLKSEPELNDMAILQKGSRLSITPLTEQEFEIIRRIGTRVTANVENAQVLK